MKSLVLISESAGITMAVCELDAMHTAGLPVKNLDSSEKKLLDAAIRVFMFHGYAGASVREIAKDAGMTIGTLYHYAESKEALFVRLVNEGYTRSIALARAATARHKDPYERILALVRTHVGGEVAERDLWRISRTELNALTPASQASIIALRDKFESVWNDAIVEGCREGCFWPRDAIIARLTLVRMCTSVGDWYDPAGRLTLAEIVELMYQQTMDILRPATEHS